MTDDEMLRDWMEHKYGGLRGDRSTASYALEFLKTSDANLALSQQRANLNLACTEMTRNIEFMKYAATWVERIMPRAEALAKDLEKLA